MAQRGGQCWQPRGSTDISFDITIRTLHDIIIVVITVIITVIALQMLRGKQ